MRKILILCMAFLLCGCQMKTESYIRQEKMREPENQPREKIVRYYEITDANETIVVTAPADYISAKEIKWRGSQINAMVTDEEYWLPSKEFITKKLLPSYKKYMKDNKINYSRKFDCDDFSALFKSFSQKFYTDLVINKTPQAIAVGEIYYRKISTFKTDFSFLALLPMKLPIEIPITVEENHAINVVILDDTSIIFIEPQSGEEINLTIKEGKSIFFCKF